MKTMNENKVVTRSLERVKFWEWNPRGGSYRGMAELKESIQREGLQDAIHVWERVDGDYLLKGHRRFEAMRSLGWMECKQVVHHFEEESAAYRFLLEDHGHTDPLSADEKIVAVENGVKMGMRTDELAPCLGVTAERAQLWFDLGKLLPMAARSALDDGRLSMNTAELLLEVVNTKDRSTATQMILKDMETGEVMSHGQARAYIQAHYVLPEKWRKEWVATELKLKKKLKVAEGHHYIAWEERKTYIMGESGQPEPEFEFASSFMPREKHGRTFGELAGAFEVPVYVVPAPLHKDGYVMLVQSSMLRDAMSVSETGRGGEEETLRGGDEETGRAGEEETGRGGDEEEESGEVLSAQFGSSQDDFIMKRRDEEERLRMWLRSWLGAIYEVLLTTPTTVMTSAPWLPLQAYLAHVTTDVDAGALAAWLDISERAAAMQWMQEDKKQRAPLRTALMLLLCAESDSSNQPEKVIREVAAALGIDGRKLDQKLGGNDKTLATGGAAIRSTEANQAKNQD